MATGAAGDRIFRGIFEGSISGHDLEISKRPYHRNCGCALHKSRGKCSHSSRYMTISYPIRRSWSEGCLSLVAAASPAASGHSSGCSSPAVADIGKRNLHPVNEDGEDLVFSKEEDKAKLVLETRLQLKQVNNWFINQRKRNWHSTPSSYSTQKTKHKKVKSSRIDQFT